MANGQVAAVLSSLPTRHAWVHSGDERGVIKTFETPAKLDDEHFKVRYNNVLRQTRIKYTVPREQLQPQPEPQPTVIQPATTPAQLLQVKPPVATADPAPAVEDEEEEPSPVLNFAPRKRGRPPKAKPTEDNEQEE